MKNCNKVKDTCGGNVLAACTSYEGTVNEDSVYKNNECLSIEDTTQDVYNQLKNIGLNNDLSDLGNKCLSYVKVSGKNIVKNVLLLHEKEICDLKAEVKSLKERQFCDMPIGDCITDFKCLTDPCSSTITTWGQLIKALVSKTCTP